MRIRSDIDLLYTSGRSAQAYQKLTKTVSDRLSIFKNGFGWYLELSPGGALAPSIGRAREEIKSMRDVVKVPGVLRSSAKCASQAKKFWGSKSKKQALQLAVAGSDAIMRGSSFALWLKRIGITQLMLGGKDLTGVFSSAHATCELAYSALWGRKKHSSHARALLSGEGLVRCFYKHF